MPDGFKDWALLLGNFGLPLFLVVWWVLKGSDKFAQSYENANKPILEQLKEIKDGLRDTKKASEKAADALIEVKLQLARSNRYQGNYPREGDLDYEKPYNRRGSLIEQNEE